jgi:Ca-activated chloride channel homolog
MSEAITRKRSLFLIATVWVLGIGAFFLLGPGPHPPPEPTVEVMHWSTGHLFRDGLLPEMAQQFNEEGYRTQSGTRIEVKVHNVPSELQGEYLVPRMKTGMGPDLTELTDGYVKPDYGDPTIVTPSSAHWLVTVNYELGRELVDLKAAPSIVRPVIGIVTYEEMARCLGWPEKEIGFADIIALRDDPQGWANYPCAKAEWGQRPLLAFTDPTTSSTGRSLLLSLYSIAAGELPEDLTEADVSDPETVRFVKDFQRLVDHYLIGTTVLNTKIHQGPRYGHFFIMPEDNLIHLYEGTERAFINGEKVTAPPIEQRMVMIYPKEGSMPRSNCACVVQADWVTEEQVEAAEQWTAFLLEDEQQRAFMAAGFRPGTNISLTDPSSKITAEFGLDPTKPGKVLNPSLMDPAVAAAIDESWEDVKRPGIVTFVIDRSGSMEGTKLQQAQDGLIAALDAMAQNNQVGLVSFDDKVQSPVAVGPLAQNRFAMADAIESLKANGKTALYDAIEAGIRSSDAADGDPNAIRAVVVLTDGRGNRGETRLDDLIDLMSRDEVPVSSSGQHGDSARDARGNLIDRQSVIGAGLAVQTEHPIQIFFIGIGDDADLQIGRMLAQATGAEFQGVAEHDLANLLAEFSKYF